MAREVARAGPTPTWPGAQPRRARAPMERRDFIVHTAMAGGALSFLDMRELLA
jgi:hypothetical protein